MDAVSAPYREQDAVRLRPGGGPASRPPTPRQAAPHTLRVLVVDDDHALQESCAKILGHEGYGVTPCRRGDEALLLLERSPFDIVLLDLDVAGVSGTDLLDAVHARSPDTIVIGTSANASVDASVAAFRSGASDYLPKPFSATHLQLVVGRAALRSTASRAESDAAADMERGDATGDMVGVFGASPSIAEVMRLARRVAATDASVFITGESGTGKERMAEFIHYQSRRSAGPLVAINCAAIPETLLETEMFGHRKGAFTGAVEDKQGLLEAANRGTFVLDELIQMPLSTQAKLLRVIQDGVVRRVGSESVNAVVNVRFIAVTNQSPEDAIRAGQLREDLYYRLRVFPIHLPPLRERREDIPVLAEHFLRLFWNRHRGGSPLPRFSDAARDALIAHAWRGNIRELQNVIEHGVVLFEPGMSIEPSDIPFAADGDDHRQVSPNAASFVADDAPRHGFYECRERLLAQFERRYVEWLLSRSSGNLSRASRIAGIQRTTLYRLMEKHGFRREIAVLASTPSNPPA